MRRGAIFIVICMAIMAGSAGAVVYSLFGVGVTEAAIVAIAALTGLALYNTVSNRVGASAAVVDRQVDDLARGAADLAGQVAENSRRLAAIEGRLEATLDRVRGAGDPLSLGLGDLGTLVKQLAETVADHQAMLDELARAPLPPPPAAAPPGVLAAEALAQRLAAKGPPPAEPAPTAPEIPPEVAAPAPAADLEAQANAAMLTSIAGAVDANRVDLYLQPIVTLPQRKVRYYEAMSRLRNERGEVMHAAEFIAHAEAGGLMPKIDNLVIFRCVQVVRRLLLKNRDIGLFCNISGATLTDAGYFPQFFEFMDANRAIASALVFEFTQSAIQAMGPIEHESLAVLAERGFRFSLDNVTDLRLEPRGLSDRGFRFVKVQANLLLNRTGGTATDIHPADLSNLLSRFGIDLIAERIESEGSVVDLLDYDVRYGQGFLFSPPRPVRAEALQGIADRGDVVARDSESPPPERAAAPTPTVVVASTPRPGTPERAQRIAGLAQLARGFASRG